MTGGGIYPGGASVTVTAAAAAGRKFTNWKENDGVRISGAANFTFTLDGNYALVANFVPIVGTAVVTTKRLPERSRA